MTGIKYQDKNLIKVRFKILIKSDDKNFETHFDIFLLIFHIIMHLSLGRVLGEQKVSRSFHVDWKAEKLWSIKL